MQRTICAVFFSLLTLGSVSPALANLCGVVTDKKNGDNRIEFIVENKCPSAIQVNACTRFMKSGNIIRDTKKLLGREKWSLSYVNPNAEVTRMRLNNCRSRGASSASDCKWICPKQQDLTKKAVMLGAWKTRAKNYLGQTLLFLEDGTVSYTNVVPNFGRCVYLGKGEFTPTGIKNIFMNGSCRFKNREGSAKNDIAKCTLVGSERIRCKFVGSVTISFYKE